MSLVWFLQVSGDALRVQGSVGNVSGVEFFLKTHHNLAEGRQTRHKDKDKVRSRSHRHAKDEKVRELDVVTWV